MKIDSTFVHLGDGGAATPIPVTDTFWTDLAGGKLPQVERGRLVMQFSFEEDWDSWETHPDAEELVLLLSGSADFITAGHGTQHRPVAE